MNEFFHNVKQGSTAYRKIIERQNKAPNVHNPTNWRKKLNDPTTTSNQVQKAIISLGAPSTGGFPQYWGNDIFQSWGISPVLGKCVFFFPDFDN